MALQRFRVAPLLAAAVLLLIACGSVVAHAAPSSHGSCGLQSADASRAINGLLEAAVVPTGFPHAEPPAAERTEAVEAAPVSLHPPPAAQPPDPRGPPLLSPLSA
jgi:hypothetical protein